MARRSKTQKSGGGNWIFVVLGVILVVSLMGNVDTYTASTAPKLKRCDACGYEPKVWWTIEFTKTQSWDTSLSSHSLADGYRPTVTLCEACFEKAYSYIRGLD